MAEMTNERLAEIRERAERATPDVKRICNDMIFKADKMLHANDMPTGFELGWLLRRVIPSLEKLRQYREDVPALLAEVERLRAELEVAKKDLQMAGWGNSCEVCAHDSEGENPPACRLCDGNPGQSGFVWRGMPSPGDGESGGGEGG